MYKKIFEFSLRTNVKTESITDTFLNVKDDMNRIVVANPDIKKEI